jgi:hypothetical protein
LCDDGARVLQARGGFTMTLADSIRKHGFRKWYERELLNSHVHLLLLFLCTIGLLAAFEVYSRQSPVQDQITNAAAIVICAAVGVWSLRRYLYLLMRAESAAGQAVCPHCGTYGRLTVVGENADHTQIRVRCRKCAQDWTMQD